MHRSLLSDGGGLLRGEQYHMNRVCQRILFSRFSLTTFWLVQGRVVQPWRSVIDHIELMEKSVQSWHRQLVTSNRETDYTIRGTLFVCCASAMTAKASSTTTNRIDKTAAFLIEHIIR
jgi:hypothetical protein